MRIWLKIFFIEENSNEGHMKVRNRKIFKFMTKFERKLPAVCKYLGIN